MEWPAGAGGAFCEWIKGTPSLPSSVCHPELETARCQTWVAQQQGEAALFASDLAPCGPDTPKHPACVHAHDLGPWPDLVSWAPLRALTAVPPGALVPDVAAFP